MLKALVAVATTVLIVAAGLALAGEPGVGAVARGSAPVAPVTPGSLAVGPNGDLYVADPGRQEILERPPYGDFQVLAGSGVAGLSGDGGQAFRARINDPGSLVEGPAGALYFAQSGLQVDKSFGNMTNSVIREVTPSGTINTLAGLHPNCSVARPSATSVRAQSAQFFGAALSLGADGALQVATTVCPDHDSLGPSLVLTPSGLLVSAGRLPAPAAVDCDAWGVRGHGFTAFSCLSGAGGTKYSHPNELLVVRDNGSFSGYPSNVGEQDLLARSTTGDVVAAHTFSIVQVTSSHITTLVSERALDRLFPGTIGVAAINGLAVGPSGDVFVAVNYYAGNRHGCGNAIAERTETGQLKTLWRSATGFTCG
jgi:hypothetical protein